MSLDKSDFLKIAMDNLRGGEDLELARGVLSLSSSA